MCCEAPLRLCVKFCNRMDVQKIPKGPPFLHFSALYDLPEASKKFQKFWNFFFVFLLFLSLRYGADLGRSLLVDYSWQKLRLLFGNS